MQSKATLETILSHCSIRKFSSQSIPADIFEQLIDAGRQASTSNHLQCVSIIRVTDKSTREAIVQASGMRYVEECAEFLVFCIDFQKHKQLFPEAQIEWAELVLIGAVDTGIMAQNVLLAAESLGLGGVYIGALRNQIEQVSTLLYLPQYCVPLVGLCLGYPAQDPPLKPRLPANLVCYENRYPEILDKESLSDYNNRLQHYYEQRSGISLTWTDSIKKALSSPVRPHILPYLQQQGLLKK